MTSLHPTHDDVLSAAADIVAAFSDTDTDRYFSKFSAQASFIFHTEAKRLNSRAEYEQLWNSWLEAGWHVIDCRSSDQLVQTFEGGAVFSHQVETTVNTGEAQESYEERETIVFRFSPEAQPQLIAIHEHLSALPAAPATQPPAPTA